MVRIEDKMQYFEYLLDKLLKWYKEYNPDGNNDFSVLKSIKLLFFVAAAKAKSGEENILLDQVFDDFYAMPLGPVESQVYNQLKINNTLSNYRIDTSCTTSITEYNVPDLNAFVFKMIDDSINHIKSANPTFINYTAFQLVEISHSWHSWAKTYGEAQILESRSKKIDINLIKEDLKIYSL